MSWAGIAWAASPIKLYGYGAGRAHPSVEHVACPICEVPAGTLCVGADGEPHLDRHYKRCDAYREWRRQHGHRVGLRHGEPPRPRIVRGSRFAGPCGFRGCTRKALRVLKVGSKPQLRCCLLCGSSFTLDYDSREYLESVRIGGPRKR